MAEKSKTKQFHCNFRYEREEMQIKDAMELANVKTYREFIMTFAYLINDGTIKVNDKFRDAQIEVR